MEIQFGATQTPVIDVVATPVEGVQVESITGAGPSVLDPAKLTAGGKTFSSPAALANATSLGVPATIGDDGGFILGDSLPGFKDIILPRINIVQGVGMLKDSFPQGAIVHGQNLVLFTVPIIDKPTGNIKVPATPPVNMTVIGFRPTRFVEKIAGGDRGIICNTEAEVRASGGTLDYSEWMLKKDSGMKRFETLAEAFVIIKRPAHVADDDTVFIYDIGGEKYALALWAMKGTAYTHAAKRVFFTARKMGCLQKGGYPSWNYSVSTRSETQKGNTYYVPVCLPTAPNSTEFLAFVRGLLNPAAAPADSAAAE